MTITVRMALRSVTRLGMVNLYIPCSTGNTETFTIRKMSGAIGVERIFPVNSPNIDKIEVNSHGKVRRAKLFYLRELTGKAARIKTRRV